MHTHLHTSSVMITWTPPHLFSPLLETLTALFLGTVTLINEFTFPLSRLSSWMLTETNHKPNIIFMLNLHYCFFQLSWYALCKLIKTSENGCENVATELQYHLISILLKVVRAYLFLDQAATNWLFSLLFSLKCLKKSDHLSDHQRPPRR